MNGDLMVLVGPSDKRIAIARNWIRQRVWPTESFVTRPEKGKYPMEHIEIAKKLVERVKAGEEIVLTTNSEYIVRYLQIAVAKEDVTTEQVSFWYLPPGEEEQRIYMDPDGTFTTKWPHGFMDVSYTLAMEFAKAREER